MEIYKAEEELINFLMENIKMLVESDIEEKIYKLPYTKATNEFIKTLKKGYNIKFKEELISEDLLDNMIDEIIKELHN